MTSIEKIYGSAGISLKKSGVRWVAECPFHKESKPSFVVYPDGSFHCFGCLAHGTLKEFQESQGIFHPSIPDLNQTKDPVLSGFFRLKNQMETELRLILSDVSQKLRFSTYDTFDAAMLDAWALAQDPEVTLVDLANYMDVKFKSIQHIVEKRC